jgi:hypothetical protein
MPTYDYMYAVPVISELFTGRYRRLWIVRKFFFQESSPMPGICGQRREGPAIVIQQPVSDLRTQTGRPNKRRQFASVLEDMLYRPSLVNAGISRGATTADRQLGAEPLVASSKGRQHLEHASNTQPLSPSKPSETLHPQKDEGLSQLFIPLVVSSSRGKYRYLPIVADLLTCCLTFRILL